MQVLVLVLVPPPQSAEHSDQAPKSLHPPTTGQGYEFQCWITSIKLKIFMLLICDMSFFLIDLKWDFYSKYLLEASFRLFKVIFHNS